LEIARLSITGDRIVNYAELHYFQLLFRSGGDRIGRLLGQGQDGANGFAKMGGMPKFEAAKQAPHD